MTTARNNEQGPDGDEEELELEDPSKAGEEDGGEKKPADAKGKEGDEGDDEEDADDDRADVSAAVKSTLDEIREATQRMERAARAGSEKQAEPKQDPRIKAALDSDSPEVRDFAKAMIEQLEEIRANAAEIGDNTRNLALQRQAERIETDITKTAETYGLNERQIGRVVKLMEENPALAGVLTFEEATLRVFPSLKTASMRPGGPRSKGPALVRRIGSVMGQIVHGSGSGGAAPKPFKPIAGGSTDQAINAGVAALFGTG